MNAETIQRIFDRFYRVDESHTTRGLGLGLAIAKRAVAAAEQAYRLARGRQESAVSSAFETILAEQEYTRLRQDFVASIADYNKAQCLLAHAIGQMWPDAPASGRK